MHIIIIRFRNVLGQVALRVYNIVLIPRKEERNDDLDLQLRNLHASAGMAT